MAQDYWEKHGVCGTEDDQWYFEDVLLQHSLFMNRAKQTAEWEHREVYEARLAHFCEQIRNPEGCLPEDLVHRYKFSAMLGSGAFGVVIAAHDHGSNHMADEVAIKLCQRADVPPDACVRHPVAGLMPEEMYVMDQLSHPNILKVLNFFSDDSSFIIIHRSVRL